MDHYEVFLVDKFLPLRTELTVYISCPKECFFQGISQIILRGREHTVVYTITNQ